MYRMDPTHYTHKGTQIPLEDLFIVNLENSPDGEQTLNPEELFRRDNPAAKRYELLYTFRGHLPEHKRTAISQAIHSCVCTELSLFQSDSREEPPSETGFLQLKVSFSG